MTECPACAAEIAHELDGTPVPDIMTFDPEKLCREHWDHFSYAGEYDKSRDERFGRG